MVCGADIPIDEISDLQSKNQTCLKNQVQGTLRKEMDTETEKLLSMGVIEKINASERLNYFPCFHGTETRRFLPSHFESEEI